jgi:tRNA dimethylallyltransferase
MTEEYPKWIRGRILNSDAMQVYRGLDIVTNKIPLDEQNGVEHCLMGFKEPGDQYVVGEFVQDASKIVSLFCLQDG